MGAVSLGLKILKIGLFSFNKNETLKEIVGEFVDVGIKEVDDFIKKQKDKINHLLALEDKEMKKQDIPHEQRAIIRENIIDFINGLDLETFAKNSTYDESKLGECLANKYMELYEQHTEYGYKYHQRMLYSLVNYAMESIKDSKDFEKERILDCYRLLLLLKEEQEKNEEWKKDDKNWKEEVMRILSVIYQNSQNDMRPNTCKQEKFVENRYKEYKDKWIENLFLNNPDEYDETGIIPITLSDLYAVPAFVWKQKQNARDDIDRLLQRVANETKSEKRMLVILGQPGSGKSSLITYFLNEYDGKLTRDVLVYRFTDFKKMDWNSEEIVEAFVQRIGMKFNDLSGKILILDGFDEIYVKNSEATLNHIKSAFAKNNAIKDFSLFITCRGNYIETEKLNCDYITIQSLDESRIREYYISYIDKSKSSGLAVPLDILIENKDIFGIPIVLYMILASNIKMTFATETETNTPKTIVDIYDKIFDHKNGGGLYDVENYKDEAHRVWLSENKKKVHNASRKIALWMYQKNEGKDIIPQENFKEIIEEEGMDAKEVKIGNFFRHCEGTEGEDKTSVCFVHRSIYQYFVADAICSAVEKQIMAPTDENRKTFIKEIVPYIKEGELDLTTGEYLKYKFEKAYGIAKEKSYLFLWLEDALLEAVKTSFCGISGTATKSFQEFEKNEMNCFVNILVILFNCRTWNIEGRKVMQDKQIDNLALYIRHNGIAVQYSLFLYNFYLEQVNLSDVNLRNANLQNATLRNANLWNAKLRNANLQNADLEGANLCVANLMGARMRKVKMKYVKLRESKLNGAYLAYACLDMADLRYAELDGADLHNSFLNRVNLRYANLKNVSLRTAHLYGVDFRGANLDNVNFVGAGLEDSIMSIDAYTKEERMKLEKEGVIFK